MPATLRGKYGNPAKNGLCPQDYPDRSHADANIGREAEDPLSLPTQSPDSRFGTNAPALKQQKKKKKNKQSAWEQSERESRTPAKAKRLP